MKITGIIPARFSSSRFPGKPLVEIQGRTMIQRVYEQAVKSRLLHRVFVATDDDRICDHVRAFGGNVIMTNTNHVNGTERCAEAAGLLADDEDAIINIQGDEPFIDPEQIDLVAMELKENPDTIVSLIKKLESFDEYLRPGTVKVVVDKELNALYFSRAPLPHIHMADASAIFYTGEFYKHIGIYGFPKHILKEIVALPQSFLEKAESLEQLRWLENGFRIRTRVTHHESRAVDTPEDLERMLQRMG